MSDEENRQDNPPSTIKIEGDGAQVDNVLIENTAGTAIEIDGAEDVAIRESKFRNAQTAVRSKDSSLILYRISVINSAIGFDAQEGTEATVVDVAFDDSTIADIVYYDDVSIELLDVVAKRVLEITQPRGLHPADIELNRKAHHVISTTSNSGKREAFLDLSISARDITEQVGVNIAAQYIMRMLGL